MQRRYQTAREVCYLRTTSLRFIVAFKSQPRRCRVTVLGKLFTPIVPLFTKLLLLLKSVEFDDDVALLIKCCRFCHGTACDFGVRNRKHRLCCT